MRRTWVSSALSLALGASLGAFPSIRVDGEPVAGALTADDIVDLAPPLLLEGLEYRGGDRYHDIYTFHGNRSDAVQIELTAQRDDSGNLFDTHLILAGPQGAIQHTRSVTLQGGRTFAAFPNLALSDNGTYFIIVTSWGSHVTGPYSLRVRIASATEDSRLSSFPQTLQGNLVDGHDAYLPEGAAVGYDHLRDGFVFSTNAPSDVDITLQCSGFDGILYLLGPDGRVFSQAETMSVNNVPAVIRARLHSAGDHRIVVATMRRPFGESPYTLRVNVAEVQEAPAPAPGPPNNYEEFIRGLEQRQNR